MTTKVTTVQWNHHSKVNKCVNQLNVSCCWFIILWMIYVTVFINITTFNYLGDSIAEAHNFGFKMTICLYKQTSVLILLLKHLLLFYFVLVASLNSIHLEKYSVLRIDWCHNIAPWKSSRVCSTPYSHKIWNN